MDYDRREPTRHHQVRIDFSFAAHFADNSRIAFSSVTSAAVAGADVFVGTWSHRKLSALWRNERFPAWAPDGNVLRFRPHRAATGNLRLDNSGRNLKRITTSRGPDVSPSWNPKTVRRLRLSAAAAACRKSLPWKPMARIRSA